MPTFTDDFERADGGLGDNWQAVYGSPYIASGIAYFVWAMAAVVGDVEGNVQSATIRSNIGGEGPGTLGFPTVQINTSTNDCYYGAIEYGWYTERYARIYRRDGANSTQIASVRSDHARGRFDVTLTWSSGHLSLAVDGTTLAEVDDSTYSANKRVGVQQTNLQAGVEWFQSQTPEPPSLTIEPAQVWFVDPIIFLQATLHDATWEGHVTEGRTLSTDKGFVNASYIEDETHCSFEWAALAQSGTVTVTDSITGATGTFLATVYPPEGSGGSWPLTEEGSDILNRTGEACPEGTILTTCDEPALHDTLIQIWRGVNGGIELTEEQSEPGHYSSINRLAFLALSAWQHTEDVGYYSANDLLEMLGGTPTIYSNADIMAALGNIGGLTLEQLIDALHDVQGEGLPTIADILAAIPTLDLTPVMNAIAALRGDSSSTVADAQDAAESAASDAASVKTSLAAYRTVSAYTVQDILDAIAGISIPPPVLDVPPVWPGLGNVTIGEPIALTNQVNVTTPCDGVLFDLTTNPSRTGSYNIGGQIYHYGLGWIAFKTDNGYTEPWQYLGFGPGIYTCKTMTRAGGFRATILAGGEGTITPWVKS